MLQQFEIVFCLRNCNIASTISISKSFIWKWKVNKDLFEIIRTKFLEICKK